MTSPAETTSDLNVAGVRSLASPRELANRVPADEAVKAAVVEGRRAIGGILNGTDDRVIVVVGPCSIHDEALASEYAARLAALRPRIADRILPVMRTYFEKPRTTVGWKGLVNDPHLDGTFDIEGGLAAARRVLRDVCRLGIPTATEFLDPIVPQYTADLIGWAAIGARTTESQTHRQMASGLSMPVGFKNNTDGNLRIAVDAMTSAAGPHAFLGIDHEGRTCIVQTRGNRQTHLILRGGQGGPNYDAASVDAACAMLTAAGRLPLLMVDCSHANASKDHRRQGLVFRDVIARRAAGDKRLMGVMLESHLLPGKQDFKGRREDLRHGVSITDACIGWEETEALLLEAHAALSGNATGATATLSRNGDGHGSTAAAASPALSARG